MDNFERRLAASMKIAAVQRPDVGPGSSRASKRRAGFMALAAAVLIGSVIAGTTWLFNPSTSGPADSPTDSLVNLEGQWMVSGLYGPYNTGLAITHPIRVTFSDGIVTIDKQGECAYSARYTQSGERGTILGFTMRSGLLVTHDAKCIGQKRLYRELVDVRGASESQGVLTLLAGDGSTLATLERISTEPIILEGDWKVTALTDAEGRSVLTGRLADKVRLNFDAGKMTGTTGCNDVFADYKQSGPSGRDLTFPNGEGFGSTLVGCSDEPPLMTRLLDVRHVSQSNGVLYLHAQNWMIIAVLERLASSSPHPLTLGTLSESEFSVAMRVAKDEQARIRGTFVGATATAHNDTFKKGDCPSGRTLHIRLVWDRDANFDHFGIGLPDGPRKALILFAGPKTGHVCRTESRYRDVGAAPNETLLYGEWPDPKDS